MRVARHSGTIAKVESPCGQAQKKRTRDKRQATHQCMLSVPRLFGMLSEYTSDGSSDHVEKPSSYMGKQYASRERGCGTYHVGPNYAPNNCHAFHSERPRDRFLVVDSSPE